jgi:hypothetical protein
MAFDEHPYMENFVMRESRKRNQKTKERLQSEKTHRRNRQEQHEHQAYRRGMNGSLRNQRRQITEEDNFPQDDINDE